MALKVKEDAKAPKPLTVEELVAGIGDSLKQTGGVISQQRQHSVESHLRTGIRTLGFKPRETPDAAGKITTTIPELHRQLSACIDEGGEVTEAQHEHLRIHLAATHSNCLAELGMKAAPELKEAPASKTNSGKKTAADKKADGDKKTDDTADKK